VGVGCRASGGKRVVARVAWDRGDWFLGNAQIIKKYNTTLTRFRPEPGFFGYRVFIG